MSSFNEKIKVNEISDFIFKVSNSAVTFSCNVRQCRTSGRKPFLKFNFLTKIPFSYLFFGVGFDVQFGAEVFPLLLLLVEFKENHFWSA